MLPRASFQGLQEFLPQRTAESVIAALENVCNRRNRTDPRGTNQLLIPYRDCKKTRKSSWWPAIPATNEATPPWATPNLRRSACMNEKERQNSPDSSQSGHGSEFEDLGERRSDKSPFQWALEIEDLLDKQKPKHDLDDMPTRRRYIE
jgi:hypothetical protein